MAENTEISWTHNTFNPWIGCQKVSAGCDHEMLPADWGQGWDNIWLGITAEDQDAYQRRWPILHSIPAVCRFISYEPAVGPLRLAALDCMDYFPDWLIWGGESGAGARVMQPKWARDVTAECVELGVAVFGKQWGTYKSNPVVVEGGDSQANAEVYDPPKNGKGGALLDGKLWRQFPQVDRQASQGSLFF